LDEAEEERLRESGRKRNDRTSSPAARLAAAVERAGFDDEQDDQTRCRPDQGLHSHRRPKRAEVVELAKVVSNLHRPGEGRAERPGGAGDKDLLPDRVLSGRGVDREHEPDLQGEQDPEEHVEVAALLRCLGAPLATCLGALRIQEGQLGRGLSLQPPVRRPLPVALAQALKLVGAEMLRPRVPTGCVAPALGFVVEARGDVVGIAEEGKHALQVGVELPGRIDTERLDRHIERVSEALLDLRRAERDVVGREGEEPTNLSDGGSDVPERLAQLRISDVPAPPVRRQQLVERCGSAGRRHPASPEARPLTWGVDSLCHVRQASLRGQRGQPLAGKGTTIRPVFGRLLGLGLLAAAVAAYVASRRREAVSDMSQNGGSQQRSAPLQRELERQ
jgi:hypothetical protein